MDASPSAAEPSAPGPSAGHAAPAGFVRLSKQEKKALKAQRA